VTELKSRISLKARVGIATGVVGGGDLIGAGETQERGIAFINAAILRAPRCAA